MSTSYANVAANSNVLVHIHALRRLNRNLTLREREYCVQYLGRSEDLLAIGAVTPAMIAPGRKGVRRKDEGGRYFLRCRLPSGKFRFTFYRTAEEAALLPGVTKAALKAADEREAIRQAHHERQERRDGAMSDTEREWHMGRGYAQGWGERLVSDDSIPDEERAAAVREFYALVKARAGVFTMLQSANDWPLRILLDRLRELPLYRQGQPALRVIRGGLT